MPNAKIYEILEKLQNRGLVSWIIKGKVKHFQASEPRKILTLFKEKERRISELIPVLEAKQLLAKEKQSVELLEGPKAIFAFLTDLIEDGKKNEEYYSFSLGKEHENKKIEWFYRKFGDRREEKGLKVKIIASIETKKIFREVYTDRTSFLKKIVRFTNFNFPQGIIIFRDHIITISWDENPMAIHVQSKNMAEQYKKFFEELWINAKE